MADLHNTAASARQSSLDSILALLEATKPDVALFHTRTSVSVATHLLAKLPIAYFAHEYGACCPAGSLHFRLRDQPCDVSEAPNWRCLVNAYTEGCHTRRPAPLVASFRGARDLKGWVSRVGAVVCASRYAAGRHRLAGYDPGRLHVLPYPVPLPATSPDVIEAAPFILYSGRLVSNKGVQVVLSALPRIRPDVELRILGDGPFRGELERISRDKGITSRVHFMGALPALARAEYINSALVAVVPSLWPEPFGIVGPEALGFECPVVASRTGGIGEWLVEGETGLGFPPGDDVALAACVNQLIDAPDLRHRLGANGRNLVASRFSIDDHVLGLEKVFESLIGS